MQDKNLPDVMCYEKRGYVHDSHASVCNRRTMPLKTCDTTFDVNVRYDVGACARSRARACSFACLF